MIFLGAIRGRRRRVTANRRNRGRQSRSIGHHARRAGREVLDFKRGRDAEEPRSLSTQAGWRSLLPHSSRRRPSQALRDYWHETISLYMRELGADVRAIVRALRDGGMLTEAEAAHLCNPCHPEDIEAIGMRLIEIGEELRGRREAA